MDYTKECLDALTAHKMDWNAIIRSGDRYRIDSLIGGLAQFVGRKAHKKGWRALTNPEIVVYTIDALCRHCYMDGVESFVVQAEDDVKKSAISSLQVISSKGKLKIITQALSSKKSDFSKLSDRWMNDDEDLCEMTWKWIQSSPAS